MSPHNRRDDAYLSLCLAQAEMSPLNYRHGSIIVRGGKVIGMGFNSYRPGFDGGALKTGVLAASSLNGPALVDLKQRFKLKPKIKSKSEQENQQQQTSATFTPFEIIGNGHNSNAPLSLHSEMMAIHTSKNRASPYQVILKNENPVPEVSTPTQKQSLRRQRQAEANLMVASSLFKSRVLNPLHLNQVAPKSNDKSNNEEDSEFQEEKNQNVASNTWKSAEKDRLKKKEYKYGYQNKSQNHYHHKNHHNHYQHKRGSEPRSQQILITKKATISSKPSVAERTQDLRLKGSDLYVARLGSCASSEYRSNSHKTIPKPRSVTPSLAVSEPTSLYDELSPLSRLTSADSVNCEDPVERPEIRESRPCYRCVTAMHNVGIKRVFWTNANGDWEGAKVRDLVDALEGGGGEEASGGGDKGVFVTKHEILMLRRVMGFTF
ncbi:hypothetical protein G7Y89_g4180 [Cudoniella acicularis]|uniref:CMP/dCMP-type deaminase domain-containing protein n=1 Tax=Cudoniella acicularis TaxID=354080 RepID=A0A8H4W4Y4_9HELO|nr:hypothetical protein G7Y89_g4180 [Cudoniella acicularis]